MFLITFIAIITMLAIITIHGGRGGGALALLQQCHAAVLREQRKVLQVVLANTLLDIIYLQIQIQMHKHV